MIVKQNGRNLLVYAIGLGLLAAGFAAWYISTAEAAANPTVPVVVAKAAIPARTLITEDMLTIKKMPQSAVHPESSTNMTRLLGKTTKQSLAPGEAVLVSKLFQNREQTGLAFVLPEGHRAVAISVNERSSAGGLVVPGDKVDIIGACQVNVQASPGGSQGEISRVGYAFQDVEVLAVAQEIVGEEPVSPGQAVQAKSTDSLLQMNRTPEKQPAAKTVTLSLKPEDAQKVIMLETHPSCDLRLALRAADDHGVADSAVVDFNPAVSMSPIVGR